MFHAWSTHDAYREAKRASKDVLLPASERAAANARLKSVPWRALFVGGTLLGELLLSISSKGHGEGVVSDNTVDSSVIAVAADLIVKQPTHMQDQLIDYMAKFLGRPDVLAMKDEEVTNLLRRQVESLRRNPWAVAETASQPAEKRIAAALSAKDGPAWQGRLAAESPAPHLSA